MVKNHASARRAASVSRLPVGQASLRNETARALEEMAYVLHITRTMKKAILEEKGAVAVAK